MREFRLIQRLLLSSQNISFTSFFGTNSVSLYNLNSIVVFDATRAGHSSPSSHIIMQIPQILTKNHNISSVVLPYRLGMFSQ